MGHQLKLSIYCFNIKEKGARNAEDKILGEFFRENLSKPEENPLKIEKKDLFKRFIEEFLGEFEDKFILDKENEKGIGAAQISFNSRLNFIHGIIKGGLTGIDQEVYNKSNPDEKEDTLDGDKITALPYYFKLWMPFDGTVGVLMIQGYTDGGVNSLILKLFTDYFSIKNYTLKKYSHVPNDYAERFKNKSFINKVTYLKQGLGKDSRKKLNPVFTEMNGLKIKIEISGFKEIPDNFLKQFFKSKKIVNSDLSALEMVDNDDFETVVTYKDEYGHQSKAKVSKRIDISPTIFLPDSLKTKGSEFPDIEKISAHTNKILEEVKKDINYTPDNVE